MLNFKVDWERSPRVRDRLLRATWARLEIHARDGTREICLTDCVGERSRSLRRGVYGSVYPVARWIVENWWSLLYESIPSESYQGGRSYATDPSFRPWVRRHNLLAARGGFALPDVSLYRDGGEVALRCVPDPDEWDGVYPIRFVRNSDMMLAPADAEQGLRDFIETVADRIREHSAGHREGREFLKNWEAVQESGRSEAGLCEAAAAMGLDPYDPDELSEQVASLLEGPFASLSPDLRWDLAESTSGPTLPADLDWVLDVAGPENEAIQTAVRDTASGAAFRFGYDSARDFRGRFKLSSPVDDLTEFVRDHCGWNPDPAYLPPEEGGVANRIGGLVGPTAAGELRLVSSAEPRFSNSRRFLIGRALFFCPTPETAGPSRLLTRAASWPQRASRAFAAELLAPAEALAARISSRVTSEQIADLASEFQVSQMVIQHQLSNHRLATVDVL